MQKAVEVTHASEDYRRPVPVLPSDSAAQSGGQKGEGEIAPELGNMARGSPRCTARMVT